MTSVVPGDFGRIPMSPYLSTTLSRAASYAQAQGHLQVTVEHLLLALAEDPEASIVLKLSNIDVVRLSTDVSAHLGRIEERAQPGASQEVLVSTELKRILEAAAAAASQGRRREINGAIVLAAIVGEGRTPAAHMLRAQGLTFEEAIRALQRSQSQPAAPPAGAPGQVPRGSSTEDILAGARERVQSRTQPPSAPRPSAPAPAPMPDAAEYDGVAAAPQLPSMNPSIPPQSPVPIRRAPEPDNAIPSPVQQSSAAAGIPLEPRWEPAVLGESDSQNLQDLLQAPGERQDYSASRHAGPTQQGQAGPGVETSQGGFDPMRRPAPASSNTQPAPALAPQPAPGQSMASAPAIQSRPDHQPSTALPSLPPGGASAGSSMPPPAFPTTKQPRTAPASVPPAQPAPQQWAPPPASAAAPTRPPPRMPPPLPTGAPPRSPQAAQPISPATPVTAPNHGGPNPVIPPQSRGGPAATPPWAETADPRLSGPRPRGTAASDSNARMRTEAPTGGRSPGAADARARSGAPVIQAGQLLENIPRRMRVGIPIVVEARVARAEVRAVAHGMQGSGTIQRHEILVSKAMTVRLRAPEGGFYIETASPETQWIDNVLGVMADDFAIWRWAVTPKEAGRRRLQLVVSARTVGGDGLMAETALPDQVIDVRVGINFARTAMRWSGWVVAAVLGGVLARFGESAFVLGRQLIDRLTSGS